MRVAVPGPFGGKCSGNTPSFTSLVNKDLIGSSLPLLLAREEFPAITTDIKLSLVGCYAVLSKAIPRLPAVLPSLAAFIPIDATGIVVTSKDAGPFICSCGGI